MLCKSQAYTYAASAKWRFWMGASQLWKATFFLLVTPTLKWCLNYHCWCWNSFFFGWLNPKNLPGCHALSGRCSGGLDPINGCCTSGALRSWGAWWSGGTTKLVPQSADCEKDVRSPYPFKVFFEEKIVNLEQVAFSGALHPWSLGWLRQNPDHHKSPGMALTWAMFQYIREPHGKADEIG